MVKNESGKYVMTPGTEPTAEQLAQIDRQYGMFLHFGMNTFLNQEWSDGSAPVTAYCPTAIHADQWVRTAYEAGMKFVILITKHHDGFCMWDTRFTDYCVTNSPNPTDVVAEVAKACKRYGIKLGLYYSLWDQHEPSYEEDFSQGYLTYMMNQLTELLDARYGEVVELWFDGPWTKLCPEWRFDLIYDLVKRLQLTCQIGINHTIGNPGLGDPEEKFLPENYSEMDPIRNFPSDFRLWDPHICRADDPKLYTHEDKIYYLPFEQTICSREGFSWFYSNIYEDKKQIPVQYIVDSYHQLTSQSNLMVVNMPPNTDGYLVPGDMANLYEVAEILGIRRDGASLDSE